MATLTLVGLAAGSAVDAAAASLGSSIDRFETAFTPPQGGPSTLCVAGSSTDPLSGPGFIPGNIKAISTASCSLPTGAGVTVTTEVRLEFSTDLVSWSTLATAQGAGSRVAGATAAGCAGGGWYQDVGTHTFTFNGETRRGETRGRTINVGCGGVEERKPCDPDGGVDLVTIADVVAIFGAEFDTPTVRDGLPSLNTKMRAAHIDNPRRCAAFLATLRHESRLTYNAGQEGTSSKYRGRGFIQLTGKANYKAAGTHLGHDFLTNPSHASTTAWSAAIATWYWTTARPNSNTAADNLDMGLISRYIGYSKKLNPAEDLERCHDFKTALHYYTGTIPDGITCLRH